MNLKQIARKYVSHDGALVWWLIPYGTIKARSVARQFEQVVPRTVWNAQKGVFMWSEEENTFVMMEGLLVDLEFTGSLTPELANFQQYWNERPADLTERFEAFSFALKPSLIDTFWQAYTATRETLVEQPGSPDPEAVTAAAPTS